MVKPGDKVKLITAKTIYALWPSVVLLVLQMPGLLKVANHINIVH